MGLNQAQQEFYDTHDDVTFHGCPEGFLWAWPENDAWVWSHSLKAYYTLELALRLVPKPRFAIQAGGCYGFVPGLMSRIFQRVLTFEPDPENYKYLALNSTLFPGLRISPFCLGTGAPYKLVRADPLRDTESGKPTGSINGGLTRVVSDPNPDALSSFRIDDLKLAELDALILDAEESEPDIIAGAMGTITRCRPFMIVCETITDDMANSLYGLGYKRGADLGGDASFWNV